MARENSKASKTRDSAFEPAAYVPGQTTAWNESWRTLHERLGDVILMYARQEGLNEHSVQDVLQEVLVTVLRAQRGEVAGRQQGQGSFRKWLQGVVHNRVRTIRRKDRKEQPLPPRVDSGADEEGPTLPEISQAPPDFEQMDEQKWQKAILAAALQRVRARVQPENFAIYLALLEEGEGPDQLARSYGKTANNIYRIKNSCQTMLVEEAKALQENWRQLRRAA
jgi:RNA polymerase sigma factor (sigma-70 family)